MIYLMRHAQSRDRWSVTSIGPPKGHVIHAQPAVIVWEMDSDLHGVFHLFSSTPSGSRIVNLLTIRLFACQSNRGHSLHFGGRDGSALIREKKNGTKCEAFFCFRLLQRLKIRRRAGSDVLGTWRSRDKTSTRRVNHIKGWQLLGPGPWI